MNPDKRRTPGAYGDPGPDQTVLSDKDKTSLAERDRREDDRRAGWLVTYLEGRERVLGGHHCRACEDELTDLRERVLELIELLRAA